MLGIAMYAWNLAINPDTKQVLNSLSNFEPMPKITVNEPLPFSSSVLIGVDEAGRGPLAGPVVVAAVLWPTDCELPVFDSKKLSAKQREYLFDEIMSQAQAVHIAIRSAQDIDASNILAATLDGMTQCIHALEDLSQIGMTPVVVDGNQFPVKPAPEHHYAVIKGDSRVPAVSAASILAKVTRDRMMAQLDKEFPQYGFAKHQGYGTAFHLEALKRWGPCIAHRQTFAPVKDWVKLGCQSCTE